MRLLAALVIAAACSAQVNVITNWAGDTGTGSPTYKDHPDAAVCVGPSQVLQVTGQNVTAWDKSGNVVSGYPVTFPALLSGAVPSVSLLYTQENDPRCVYNEFAARFVIAVGGLNNIGPVLLVSSGSDLASATWLSSAFGGSTQSGDTTPHIGYNKWWTIITHDDSTLTTQYLAYVIPNADIAASPISLAHMAGPTVVNYECFAAADHSTSRLVTDPLYILGRGTPPQSCSNCTVTFHTFSITGVDSTHPVIGGLVDVNSGSGAGQVLYNTPVTGPQQPGAVVSVRSTESHRFESFVQSSGHVYGVLNTGPKAGETYGGFVAFDLNMNGTPSMGNVARVFGGSTDQYLFGDIQQDNGGNLVICGARQSTTVFASLVCWYSTDSLATINGPTTVYAGTASYPGGSNNGGWGTYGGSALDPADGTKIWVTNQYGGSATANQWTTRIAEVSISTPFAGSLISGTVRISGKTVH